MTPDEELFAATALPMLMERKAEWITYHPAGGAPRPIKAIVERNPPDAPLETANVQTTFVTISVENHPIRGIDSQCLDTGGDEIEVAVWPGESPKRLSIKRRTPQCDAAMLRLECR